MMKNGEGDKEKLKNRVKDWMGVSGVNRKYDAFDMLIMETFFYLYNGLEEGFDIRELGNDLGIFPIP